MKSTVQPVAPQSAIDNSTHKSLVPREKLNLHSLLSLWRDDNKTCVGCSDCRGSTIGGKEAIVAIYHGEWLIISRDASSRGSIVVITCDHTIVQVRCKYSTILVEALEAFATENGPVKVKRIVDCCAVTGWATARSVACCARSRA